MSKKNIFIVANYTGAVQTAELELWLLSPVHQFQMENWNIFCITLLSALEKKFNFHTKSG